MERDNLINKLRALEYSKDLAEKTNSALNFEVKDLKGQVDALMLRLERERLQQEKILEKKYQMRAETDINKAN